MMDVRSVLDRGIGLLALIFVLGGCFGAYQVSPDTPMGAEGLKPTQHYPVIGVERFPVAKSEIEDEGDRRFADGIATFYQSEIVRRLRDTGLFSRVVNLSEADLPAGTERALRLRGTITRLGRGSQAARYLIGFGAGSTRVQAEMHFVEVQSSRAVLVTADRRLGSMGLFGGDSGDFVRESFDDMARDLAKFLVRFSKGEAPKTE
jgi:hypothetical protein